MGVVKSHEFIGTLTAPSVPQLALAFPQVSGWVWSNILCTRWLYLMHYTCLDYLCTVLCIEVLYVHVLFMTVYTWSIVMAFSIPLQYCDVSREVLSTLIDKELTVKKVCTWTHVQ